MKVTLKDGSVKEYAQAMSVIDIAKDLSEGLARAACAGEVDGEVVDLRTVVDHDAAVNILTAKDEKGLAALRHTTSHVMAQAVKRLYPNTKLAIGPSIADGFYYDMEFETPLTSDDFEKIEAEMKKIVKEDLKIERFTLPREKAIEFMKEKEEPYKVELIEDLPEGEEISFYQQGEFVDLCAGSSPDEHQRSWQGIQDHEPCRCILERRRTQPDADQTVCNRFCKEGRAGSLHYHDGRGEKARPQKAGQRAGTVYDA